MAHTVLNSALPIRKRCHPKGGLGDASTLHDSEFPTTPNVSIHPQTGCPSDSSNRVDVLPCLSRPTPQPNRLRGVQLPLNRTQPKERSDGFADAKNFRSPATPQRPLVPKDRKARRHHRDKSSDEAVVTDSSSRIEV